MTRHRSPVLGLSLIHISRIRERAFVMVPLSDLFPGHQAFGYDFHDAYEAVDKGGVLLYK